LAAIAMLVQNVLAVFLVQAEARNRALLAGLLDCLMWPAGMVTTTITVTALQGHHAGLKGEVIAAVTLANFVGSSAAVSLGRRFIRARQAGHERIRAHHPDRLTADHPVRVEAGNDEGEPAARPPRVGQGGRNDRDHETAAPTAADAVRRSAAVAAAHPGRPVRR
jgi:hypothetical protein